MQAEPAVLQVITTQFNGSNPYFSLQVGKFRQQICNFLGKYWCSKYGLSHFLNEGGMNLLSYRSFVNIVIFFVDE